MPYRLGKLPARHDPRTLLFETYATPALPPAPASLSWAGKVSAWPMMANDRIGDCTCASAGHLIECWTANAGKPVTPTDHQIVAAYAAVTGYDPKTGANDNGAVLLDVLNYWRKHGIAGHRISAYVQVKSHVRDAVNLFGGCYAGLRLPVSAQNQKVWSVVSGPDSAPGSWGGHAVPIVAYDQKGLTVVTWGQLKRMTWKFWYMYGDEAFAVLSPDWLNNQVSPEGFDLAALTTDLHAVAA
jgi:hypothetical protein